ncbi:hypothetical protein GJ496_009143 [Pomphorhynchus laevis]|nr:hypothetical protein GJ496_009143 [Pomphorhynchus laevis]
MFNFTVAICILSSIASIALTLITVYALICLDGVYSNIESIKNQMEMLNEVTFAEYVLFACMSFGLILARQWSIVRYAVILNIYHIARYLLKDNSSLYTNNRYIRYYYKTMFADGPSLVDILEQLIKFCFYASMIFICGYRVFLYAFG